MQGSNLLDNGWLILLYYLKGGVFMSLVVGVDVAKFNSMYSFFATNGTLIEKPFKVDNDAIGLISIISRIEKVANVPDETVIIMESTRYFSNRLRDFFLSHQFKVMEINPLVSNSIRKVSIRKVKNDKVDSIDLANLYLTSLFNQSIRDKLHFFCSADQDIINLRVLTRTHDKLIKDRTSIKIRLISDLEQVLPYYSNVFNDPTCKSSLAILSIIDQNTIVKPLTKKAVHKLLDPIAHHKGSSYFDKVYLNLNKCLSDAKLIGRKVPSYFFSIKSYVALINHYDEQISAIDQEIKQCSKSIEAVGLLKSIPGVGDIIAPILASEIGDIDRFSSANSLVAFCGVDPTVRQSGLFNASRNKISKRGAPRLRKALYMLALQSVIKHSNGTYANKVLYDYYETKKVNKANIVALGAVIHKLVRIIYAVLKNRRPYVMITAEQQKLMYQKSMKLIA